MLAVEFQNYFGSPDMEEASNGTEVLLTCPRCACRKFYVCLTWKEKYRNGRTIQIAPGTYICHKCGFKGVAGQEQVEKETTLEERFLRAAQFMDKLQKGAAGQVEVPWFDLTYATVDVFDYPEILAYARSRKFTDEMLRKHQIRAGVDGILRGRLVIPNQVWRNGPQFWCDFYTARATYQTKRRYVNPVDSASKHSVFNLHHIEQNPPMVIVNEGSISAIFSGPYGVGTQSKTVSDEQIGAIIAKNPQRVYIASENDALANTIELATRFIDKGVHPYVIELPPGQDPNDLYPNFAPLVRKARQFDDKFAVAVFSAWRAMQAPDEHKPVEHPSIADRFEWMAKRYAEATDMPKPEPVQPDIPTDFTYLKGPDPQ